MGFNLKNFDMAIVFKDFNRDVGVGSGDCRGCARKWPDCWGGCWVGGGLLEGVSSCYQQWTPTRSQTCMQVLRIDAIPAKSVDTIKDWLTSVGIKYYESKLNLAWKPILKWVVLLLVPRVLALLLCQPVAYSAVY